MLNSFSKYHSLVRTTRFLIRMFERKIYVWVGTYSSSSVLFLTTTKKQKNKKKTGKKRQKKEILHVKKYLSRLLFIFFIIFSVVVYDSDSLNSIRNYIKSISSLFREVCLYWFHFYVDKELYWLFVCINQFVTD